MDIPRALKGAIEVRLQQYNVILVQCNSFASFSPQYFLKKGVADGMTFFISNESSNPEQADTDALGRQAPPPQFPLPTCSVLVGQCLTREKLGLDARRALLYTHPLGSRGHAFLSFASLEFLTVIRSPIHLNKAQDTQFARYGNQKFAKDHSAPEEQKH